ncbi:hypothetical protein V415_10340 [Escherichia coli LAU-EC10]|nr:hypothetical protein V415_10340 [Escherichia coli LAU-EC10]
MKNVKCISFLKFFYPIISYQINIALNYKKGEYK